MRTRGAKKIGFFRLLLKHHIRKIRPPFSRLSHHPPPDQRITSVTELTACSDPMLKMLAPKSTHKRKRSSARSDKARKLGPSRWIVNVIPSQLPAAEQAQPSLNQAGTSRNRRLEKLIDAHPFNRSLELILPLSSDDANPWFDAASPLPTSVQSLIDRITSLTSSHREYRARIPLSLFLDPIFVTAYLKTGSLIALSDASRTPAFTPSSDDSVCLDGQGTLVLSLCKDTYRTLGLTGRASHFSRLSSGRAADRTSGPDSRFIVQLPLLSPSFVPGKKGYQQALERLRAWDRSRAQALLKEHTIAQTHASSKIAGAEARQEVTSEHATWDMLFVWYPSRALVESNPGMMLDNEIRFPEHLVRPQDVESLTLPPLEPVIMDSIWIPTLTHHPLSAPWRETKRHFTELEPSHDPTNASWSTYQQGLQGAIEWAGLASLGATAVRTYSKPDATCVYSPPPSKSGRIVKLSFSASSQAPLLLSPLLISQIASQVDAFVSDTNQKSRKAGAERVDWSTLSCAGFPHAPLTWRAKTPLSSRYGAKELPSNKSTQKTNANDQVEDAEFTAQDSFLESSGEDSDASLDMGELSTKRKKKKKSKRNVGKNQTEHSFTPNTGETGWVSFCIGSNQGNGKGEKGRWIFVELVGTDTRS